MFRKKEIILTTLIILFFSVNLSRAESVLSETRLRIMRNERAGLIGRLRPPADIQDRYRRIVIVASGGGYRRAKNMLKDILMIEAYYKNCGLLMHVLDDIIDKKLNQKEADLLLAGIRALSDSREDPFVKLNEFIEAKPNYPYAYYYRALAFLNESSLQADWVSENKGEGVYKELKEPVQVLDQAIADLDKCLDLRLNSSEIYRLRADAYIKEKQYDKALSDLDQAIAKDRSNYSAFLDRAAIYAHKNMPDQAISDLDKAIKINPVDPRIYGLRAGSYLKRGLPIQAALDYLGAGDIYYLNERTQCRSIRYYENFLTQIEDKYPIVADEVRQALEELKVKCR